MKKYLLVLLYIILTCNSLFAQNAAHNKEWYVEGLNLLNHKKSEQAYDYFFTEPKNERNNDWVFLGQGMCYLYGVGVEQDIDQAIKLLGKSAKSENHEALYQMGLLYFEGAEPILKADENRAIINMKKASDKGSTKAQIKLYEIYKDRGDNRSKMEYIKKAAYLNEPYAQYLYAVELEGVNDSVAYGFYLKAANSGEPNSLNVIGEIYEKEDKNKEAFWRYEKSAKGGNVAGMTNLGRCYHYGIGVDKDLAKATIWYSKAADDGDYEVAQYYYGLLFQDQAKDTRFTERYNNYSNAFHWFEKASNKGYINAIYRLGYCYEYGNGVPQSMTHALRYYTMASEGNAKAKVRMGRCYEIGSLDIDKDYNKAFELYNDGYIDAKQKNDAEAVAMAAYYIGSFYERGRAVNKDETKADWFYKEAVEGNNGEAAYRLYMLYKKNNNINEASKYLQKAVQLKNSDALYVYGKHLYKEKKVKEAMNMFEKAAADNQGKACFQLGMIYKDQKKYQDALRYFCRALENGEKDAAYEIGMLYRFKHVSVPDENNRAGVAARWFYIAEYMGCNKGISAKHHYEELTYKTYTADYKVFKEFYVNCLLTEWRIKGEFENNQDYLARTELVDMKISKLSEQTIDCYVKKNKNEIKKCFKISTYDANNQSYMFSSKYGKFVVKVESEVAKDFATGYMIDVEDSYWSHDANNEYKTLQKLAVKYNNNFYFSDKNNLHDPTKLVIDPPKHTDGGTIYVDVHNGIPKCSVIDPYLFVLIIGNGKYDYVDNIEFVNNDVRWFKEYCSQAMGVSAEHIVMGENLNYSGMKKTINDFCNKLKRQREDKSRVIVYYSGHGTSKDGISYLIPTDGEPDKQPLCNLYDLSEMIKDAGAKDMTFFVDACFDGSSKNGGNISKTKGVATLEPVAKPLAGNSVVFYATQTSAVVYKDKKHGLFTYYLLKAIQDNKVSYKELGEYLEDNVAETSVKINSKIEQVPIIVPGKDMDKDTWKNWKLTQ